MFLNLQNHPKLQPSKFRLSAYNGTKIPVKGCCILCITHGITSLPVLFQVVDNDSPYILGLKANKNLDLIKPAFPWETGNCPHPQPCPPRDV